jgi:Holliday junction resolvasome RuvABC endonuclease subunit
MTILGLDVSTSTIGFSVLNENGKVLELGYINLTKEPSLVEKGTAFKVKLNSLFSIYGLKKIYIEECFQRYSSGMSSAKTITRLASFNGIVQYICYNELSIVPSLISVHEARKACGIKTQSKKKAGKAVKEQVFEWVTAHLKWPWPTKVLKSGPRKGLEIIINESSQMPGQDLPQIK